MSMDLNEAHPDFDLSMEVLATIPPHPFTAKLDTLKVDFGLDGHQIRQVLRTLRDKNWFVATRKEKIFLEPAQCGLVAKVAGAYLDRVYGVA